MCWSIESESSARDRSVEGDLIGLACLKTPSAAPKSLLTWILLGHQILLKAVELVEKLLMSFKGIYRPLAAADIFFACHNTPDESKTCPIFRQAISSRRMVAITSDTSSSLGIARRNRTKYLISSGTGGNGDRGLGELTHGVAPIVARRRDLIANDMFVQAEQMPLKILL